MAPRGAAANLSFTVDSASEDESRDELNAFPTPDSNIENKAPAGKPRGKAAQMAKTAAATKNTTKAKTSARHASGDKVLGVKKQGAVVAKKPGRKALKERHPANGSDTEEVDEFDGEEEVAQPVEQAKTRRGRPPKVTTQEEEKPAKTAATRKTRKAVDEEPPPKKDTKAKAATKQKATRRKPEPEAETDTMAIPVTQPEPEPDPMDVEQSIEIDEIRETQPPPPQPPARTVQQRSRVAQQTSAAPRRAGSVSDTERDPALRRKVGDLTKKLEAMTTKYETLKEVASSAKESNFDQLKKRTEQTAKDQDAVIKALKQQLSEMQSRSSEIATLKKDMLRLEKENARLTSENKKLKDSLATSQNENKSLSTKLAAARSSAPPENKNVPSSAVKPRSTGVVLPGTAEAAKEAQFQKQKVELYSDLTDLVVLGVKKNEDEEQVYDCLQTGRNGTLHFQLSVAPQDESYEETEFGYKPLLHEQRDRELIELLPDYLTEPQGIYFPRAQAPKFYAKIVDNMSKHIILEED